MLHKKTFCITSSTNGATGDALRKLLRKSAQPVAVVTSSMPEASSTDGSNHLQHHSTKFHGATMSSFTSVALDPYPLVAFSLRVPSRMATSLNSQLNTSTPPERKPHMVIHILSALQHHLAVLFSRPDLYPDPFCHPDVKWILSKEGLPILNDSLGALSCSSAGVWPLHDLELLRGRLDSEPGRSERIEARGNNACQGAGQTSELFIAHVLREERSASTDSVDTNLRRLPLLYHDRQYTTSCSILPPLPLPLQIGS